MRGAKAVFIGRVSIPPVAEVNTSSSEAVMPPWRVTFALEPPGGTDRVSCVGLWL